MPLLGGDALHFSLTCEPEIWIGREEENTSGEGALSGEM
jgi:hypothetical protein